MAEQHATPWVCPWGICNHEQAKKCRATFGNTKLTRSCGNIFPPGTTLEQAKEMIGPPRSAAGVAPSLQAKAVNDPPEVVAAEFDRMVARATDKLQRCSLGCAEFGQCKAAMHGAPCECASGVPAAQAPSAPKPMQGLADWLRAVAETQAADAEQEACMRQWAREVDAACGVGEARHQTFSQDPPTGESKAKD